jgi:hypothetical protein
MVCARFEVLAAVVMDVAIIWYAAQYNQSRLHLLQLFWFTDNVGTMTRQRRRPFMCELLYRMMYTTLNHVQSPNERDFLYTTKRQSIA